MNLLPEIPSEVLTQFSSESAEKSVYNECNAHYKKMLEEVRESTREIDSMEDVEA